MTSARFEWDEVKDRANREKHGAGFAAAQGAFLDPHRLIFADGPWWGGGALFLPWHGGRARHDGSVHLAGRTHPFVRRRVLAERQEAV